MYVDEVGDPGLQTLADERYRYLSLTGIMINLDYVRRTVHDRIERLKRDFFANHHHPDTPVVLHRKELLNGKYPFESLRDDAIRQRFNVELLDMLREIEFRVATVVIDKFEHVARYKTWHFDPYHYCITVLIERYVLWLERMGETGDVMAESRGGKEDMRLKKSFHRLFGAGTDYVGKERIQARLTSSQLKVKAKENNIAGLQIADLIAHPSFRNTLAKNKPAIQEVAGSFGKQIAEILEESKYLRSSSGSTVGWGTKLLP